MKILLNPRLEGAEKLKALLEREGNLPDHTWFLTSGTTGKVKCAALSKNALMASAVAVNRHLQAAKEDIWLNCLPAFHVGGAGIFARAELSGSAVYTLPSKWDPLLFMEETTDKKATLTALVPTQLYDLVSLGNPPPSLRAVIIGGGALSPQLYEKALQLKWPIMPSYGLTECASQVATATKGNPGLTLLSHIEAQVEGGYLKIKSPSLLTTYAYPVNDHLLFEDPKENGWFLTEDHASIKDGILRIKGRISDFVKISGESVDLKNLEGIIEALGRKWHIDCALFPLPHERLGQALHLAYTKEENLAQLLEQYHQKVMPFERIHQTHQIPFIPRSPLNKIMKGELINFFAQI